MNGYRDPYHRLGLKRNPFIAPASLQLDGDRWCDFGYSLPILSKKPQFIQFLGVKGSGKTSHLLHWQQQTGGIYYYQKPWHWLSIPPFKLQKSGVEFTYWDEANRIPLPLLIWSLNRAYRQQLIVVVGSHLNLGAIAKLVGYQVRTIRLNNLSLPRLKAWINQQFQAELLPRRSPRQRLALEQIQQQLSESLLTMIIEQSNGSWRQAATHLHRWLARQID
jgi:hypothetical protein